MKEKTFLTHYSVIELKRNGLFEYYLSKQNFGDLMFMYSTENECFPSVDYVLPYVKQSISQKFWKE
jgi:hypothetical protein